MSSPSIVWLRDDLRVGDNPALSAAVDRGEPVVVVYILDEASAGIRGLGGARRWWLHYSLTSLAESIETLGGTLTLRRGNAEEVLPALVAEVGAEAVFWNRRYGAAREIDARLKTRFKEARIDAQSFQANLLFEPWTVKNQSGGPFQVFTPFWKSCVERGVHREPLATPETIESPDVTSDDLDDWNLLPTHPDWAAGLRENCEPGEDAAHERLETFIDDILESYDQRDHPATEATSGLSPHLAFGEISPFQIWQRAAHVTDPAAKKNVEKFLSEVGWREFNYSILFNNTDVAETNYRREFDAFEWDTPVASELLAWQQGRTGIPLVDAGMRELWESGTMHNRVRMVCASFLIKNLLVDWRIGEKWFWDCLVDADEASNPGNWQWVAGSGADAAPYFRVFNPVLQAEKFDRDSAYIKRWVPEYGTEDYPEPIVDLAASREEALARYAASRG
jgi:deoxyribodipyrimidine photo-lyase